MDSRSTQVIQKDLISRSFISSHLQRPFVLIRSHSQGPGCGRSLPGDPCSPPARCAVGSGTPPLRTMSHGGSWVAPAAPWLGSTLFSTKGWKGLATKATGSASVSPLWPQGAERPPPPCHLVVVQHAAGWESSPRERQDEARGKQHRWGGGFCFLSSRRGRRVCVCVCGGGGGSRCRAKRGSFEPRSILEEGPATS